MSIPPKQMKRYMIVFNQQDFIDGRTRKGSAEDVVALETTFPKFGIDPIVRNSLLLAEIESDIENLSTKDFNGYELFMCVLMTHGTKNDIVEAKDKPFHLEDTIVYPIIQNKTLNSIPKIFIIVACRGNHRYYKSDAIFEDGCLLSKKNNVDNSNLWICYSTYYGHKSYRSGDGTFYIQKLCELINKKGSYATFHTLLMDLNAFLDEAKIQLAEFKSTMKKEIYLNMHMKESKTIVLCGETGMGKSTLGNFIINTFDPNQIAPFEVLDNANSCPMASNVVATINTDECVINVIDTPGFGDTEGEQLNAMNVCHIWKALESDNVCAVLFLFQSKFNETTKIWYQRLLKAIPVQHHENIFIVHTQYNGDDAKKVENVKVIRRLSDNGNAKVSHVLNSPRLDDHKQEILHLFKEWTSVPPFTVENLDPPEIVYERDEYGPIEHKFYGTVTVVEPRQEFYQEVRREPIGSAWKHGRFGKIVGLREVEYGNKTYDLYRTVQKDIEKDQWIKFRNKYRIRYDQTRDFVEEEILEKYFKLVMETASGSADQ